MHHAAAIDGVVDRHLEQIGRRAVFHRAIHHRRDILRMRAEQEEVDQTILQRRAALLDRLRGEDRIDAIGHRRHHESPREGPRPGDPNGKQHQSGDEPQPMAGIPNDPARPRPERRPAMRSPAASAGEHVDQPDLPAGVFQSLLDELFVSSLHRGAFRLRTSGNRATCHDGSPFRPCFCSYPSL